MFCSCSWRVMFRYVVLRYMSGLVLPLYLLGVACLGVLCSGVVRESCVVPCIAQVLVALVPRAPDLYTASFYDHTEVSFLPLFPALLIFPFNANFTEVLYLRGGFKECASP